MGGDEPSALRYKLGHRLYLGIAQAGGVRQNEHAVLAKLLESKLLVEHDIHGDVCPRQGIIPPLDRVHVPVCLVREECQRLVRDEQGGVLDGLGVFQVLLVILRLA